MVPLGEYLKLKGKKEPLSVGCADISPARGEIGAKLLNAGCSQSFSMLAPISPLVGEMSPLGVTERGKLSPLNDETYPSLRCLNKFWPVKIIRKISHRTHHRIGREPAECAERAELHGVGQICHQRFLLFRLNSLLKLG